jgi:hypothetical protein
VWFGVNTKVAQGLIDIASERCNAPMTSCASVQISVVRDREDVIVCLRVAEA